MTLNLTLSLPVNITLFEENEVYEGNLPLLRHVTGAQLRAAAQDAVENALKQASNQGFEHVLSDISCIGYGEISVQPE